MVRMGWAHWIEIGGMDELGRMDTPAHRLDARAKAVVTLAYIVVLMSFDRHALSALVPFVFFPLVLLSVGQLPVFPLLRKIAVAAPFAIMVGMFNPWLDREPVAAVGGWVITGGWLSFASILVRFVLTVGAALVLVACTGMYRLGAGLERLGVPQLFVTQLLFLYRYLFVVADEGARMIRSVRLRSAGAESLSLRVYGSLVGHLLLRSMDRAERVHRAMVARGFDGEVRLLEPGRFRWTDTLFVVGWLAFFAVARVWNLAELSGRWLTGALA
jgi:cobalt/nickel transport system permease protein